MLFLQQSDMIEEIKGEAIELAVTACEKHAANNEVCNNNNIRCSLV